MTRATNRKAMAEWCAIAGLSSFAIFVLQDTDRGASLSVYAPWLTVLAMTAIWLPFVPVGVSVVLASNGEFTGVLAASEFIAFGATCWQYSACVTRCTFSGPTILLLFYITVSFYWTVDSSESISDFQIRTLPHWLLAFSIALTIANDTARFSQVLWIIVGTAMVGAVVTLRNYSIGQEWENKKHYYAGLVKPDYFSGWPMLAFTILVFEAVTVQRSITRRGLSGCLAVVALLGTVCTGTRSAILGATTGGLSVLISATTEIRRIIFIAVLSLLIAAIFFSDSGVSEVVIGRFTDKSVESGSGRLDNWEWALTRVFPSNPILGIGWNNYAHEMDRSGYGFWGAHSVFVQVLTELGVVGFAVFVWWCLSLFSFAKKSTYWVLLRGILIAMFVQAVFLHTTQCAYFWVVTGLVEGIRHHSWEANLAGGKPVSSSRVGAVDVRAPFRRGAR